MDDELNIIIIKLLGESNKDLNITTLYKYAKEECRKKDLNIRGRPSIREALGSLSAKDLIEMYESGPSKLHKLTDKGKMKFKELVGK